MCLFYAGDLVGAVHPPAVPGCLRRAEAAFLYPELVCYGQGEDGGYRVRDRWPRREEPHGGAARRAWALRAVADGTGDVVH